MNQDMVRAGRKALANTDQTTANVAGKTMVKAGATGGALMLAATVIPFFGLTAIVIMLLVIGGYLAIFK